MITTYHSEHPLNLLVCATASETGDQNGNTGDDEEENHSALVDRDAHLILKILEILERHYNAHIALVEQVKEGVPVDERPDSQCKDYPGQYLDKSINIMTFVILGFIMIKIKKFFIIIVVDVEPLAICFKLNVM